MVSERVWSRCGWPTRWVSTADVRGEVFYVSLLRFLGCTADAHQLAAMAGGDEVRFLAGMAPVAMGSPREEIARMIGLVAAGERLPRRLRALARALTDSKGGERLLEAHCEVGARLAIEMGLARRVAAALGVGVRPVGWSRRACRCCRRRTSRCRYGCRSSPAMWSCGHGRRITTRPGRSWSSGAAMPTTRRWSTWRCEIGAENLRDCRGRPLGGGADPGTAAADERLGCRACSARWGRSVTTRT